MRVDGCKSSLKHQSGDSVCQIICHLGVFKIKLAIYLPIYLLFIYY